MVFSQSSASTKICSIALTITSLSYTAENTGVCTKKIVTNKIENKVKKDVNSILTKDWLELSSSMKVNKNKETTISINDIIAENLKKSLYTWRTKDGILKDTKIPVNLLTNALNEMVKKGKIYVGMKQDGTRIFSLAETYKKNTKLILKLKDLLLGQIIR